MSYRDSPPSIREEIQIDIGFNAQINAQLDVAAVAETVVVTGVSPVLDIRSTASRVTYSSEILNALPTTRDVYNVYQQAPALVINITTVGGNTGGNQGRVLFRGGATIQQNRTWKDGVETGTGGTASPFYLDYDAVEEMQITTGGGDVTMQTPGGVISIVTKSGADLFHGSAQGFWSGKGLTSRTNVDDALRQAGASAGILLLNFKDFGAELGGRSFGIVPGSGGAPAGSSSKPVCEGSSSLLLSAPRLRQMNSHFP